MQMMHLHGDIPIIKTGSTTTDTKPTNTHRLASARKFPHKASLTGDGGDGSLY